MKFGYAFKDYGANMARAIGRDLTISSRQSLEVANMIRGMKVQNAIKNLEDVTKMIRPVKYRVRNSAPHKSGYGPAKYPISCATQIIKILKQVQANAQVKGLNTSNLEIIAIITNKASTPYRYGRKRRIKAKSTHVEIIVAEGKDKKETKKERVVKKK